MLLWALLQNGSFRRFFFTVLVTSLGPSPQSSTQCQQTFPWFTVCLVWMALGAREVPNAIREQKMDTQGQNRNSMDKTGTAGTKQGQAGKKTWTLMCKVRKPIVLDYLWMSPSILCLVSDCFYSAHLSLLLSVLFLFCSYWLVPVLSLLVFYYSWLSLFSPCLICSRFSPANLFFIVPVCHCPSLSVPSCPCLSLSVPVGPRLSLSQHVTRHVVCVTWHL